MAEHDQMYEFFKNDSDFRCYVLRCSHQYDKSVHEVLDLATTKEVYASMQRGGCNATNKQHQDI